MLWGVKSGRCDVYKDRYTPITEGTTCRVKTSLHATTGVNGETGEGRETETYLVQRIGGTT